MDDKILLINYYWPPCGGPAVQRWLDITQFIAQKGVQTYVVTIDESVATFPYVDTTLLDRIDPSTKVYTTDTSELFHVYKKYVGKGEVPTTVLIDESDPTLLQKISRFARGNFFLPDPRRGWNKHAYKMAAKLIREENIKVVFTAGPPHSSHLIGLQLKREFPGIRWVADLHDYWTDISYLNLFYRTRLAAFFDRKLEVKVLNSADAVMTHCRSSQKLLSGRITKGNRDKVFVHTVGFNEELLKSKPAEMQQEAFVISYVGTFTSNYHPEPFFKAVKEALDRVGEIPFKLRFVGNAGEDVKKMIADFDLKDKAVWTGYLPHKESIAYLYQSSALFIINPQFKNEKIHVPGKLYEYLAVFKPIVSIAPTDSETAAIISNFNAGRNFERNDVSGIADYLVQLMTEWKSRREVDLEYNPEIEKKYGRRNEAFALAERIKALIRK